MVQRIVIKIKNFRFLPLMLMEPPQLIIEYDDGFVIIVDLTSDPNRMEAAFALALKKIREHNKKGAS